MCNLGMAMYSSPALLLETGKLWTLQFCLGWAATCVVLLLCYYELFGQLNYQCFTCPPYILKDLQALTLCGTERKY